MPCGYLLRQKLVAADAREVVHVAGLCHAHRGVKQKIGFNLLGRAERKFLVRAMHGIARLEGNDPAPAQARELRTQLRRGQAQGTEIVVGRTLQALEGPPHIPGIRLVDSIVGAGMRLAGGAEHALGFGGTIGLPYVLDVQNREHHALAVAQRNLAAAGRQRLGKLFGDVERDRHRPQNAAWPAACCCRRPRSRRDS